MNLDRPLPANVSLEERAFSAVLAASDSAALRAVIESTPPETFFTAEYRQAWEVVRDLAGTGTLTPVSFAVEMEKRSETGERVTATRLLGMARTAKHEVLDRWMQDLKRLAHCRSVVTATQAAMEAAWVAERAPHEIEADLADERQRNAMLYGCTALPTMADAVDEFERFRVSLETRKAEGAQITFGIPALDDHCVLIPSYGLVLARTSHGKTAFVLSVALEQLKAGARVMIASLEQPRRQVVGRLVSLLTGRPLGVALGICDGITQEEWAAREKALEWLESVPLCIVDGQHTVDGLVGQAMRMKASGGIQALYIDQMSRIDHGQRKGETQEQAWSRTSNRLARLWQDLDCPVVLLAQLNRKDAKEHAVPSASHIKNCGSLLEDACWTFLLDRPEADDERFRRAEAKRRKFHTAGDDQDAKDADVRNLVEVCGCKDRNSTMGGAGWAVRLKLDRNSGRIYDPAAPRPAWLAGSVGPA